MCNEFTVHTETRWYLDYINPDADNTGEIREVVPHTRATLTGRVPPEISALLSLVRGGLSEPKAARELFLGRFTHLVPAAPLAGVPLGETPTW